MAPGPDKRLPGAGEGGSSTPDPAHQLVYLAAERTLLTWVRAAISLILLGFAVDRFGLLLPQRAAATPTGATWSSWLGLVLIGAGVITSGVSAIHFWHFQRRYARGDTRPGPGIPLAVGLSGLLALMGVALAACLWLAAG